MDSAKQSATSRAFEVAESELTSALSLVDDLAQRAPLVASLHVLPTSTISPYEINPVSGSARRDADTQNPDMNAASKPARSINLALSASCAQGA